MPANRRNITLSDEQNANHAEVRRQTESDKPRLARDARAYKEELDARIHAFRLLKAEREARNLSIADIASRSGIDQDQLSKLENDPYPNPPLSMLMRIADAIGVRVTIGITDKVA